MPTHTLTVPGYTPPALNALTRGRRRERIRLAKECRDFVTLYARQQSVPLAAGKRRVTLRLSLGAGQRGADVDAYWKATLDALVCAGLLVDDSDRWCEIMPVQFERGNNRQMVVTLEDL